MGKGRVALAIAVLAGMVGLSSSDTQAQESIRPEACTRELARSTLETLDPTDVGLQRAVAETCGGVGATARGIQAARARFYSGRAYSRVPGALDEAVRQLEIAVNAGQDFENDFRRESRSARLELAQAYRSNGRIEAARNVLANTALRPGDPAVAYQRSLLILAELGSAGQESAFDTLKPIFVQDDAQLRGAPNDPTGLTTVEIRRGRSWLYALGMTLGQRTLRLQARDVDQRRSDALRAIDYFRPVAEAINAACPDPQPLACPDGIAGTEQIGSLGYPTPPPSDLLNAFFQLGIAHLKAAGLQETSGLSSIDETGGVGAAGGLDCFGVQTTPDAASHFQNARFAFNTVIRRSANSAVSVADARWGLGCTILANIGNVADPSEQQRQLAQAVEQLGQAPNRPLTLLTLARAQVLQGQTDNARASYQRALALSGANTRCAPGATPNANNRAELPSRIYLEMARTRYTAPISGGYRRVGNEAGSDLFQRTITDIRYARPGSLREAEAELQCAIALNYANAEARLTLGHIYLRLGSDPTDPSIDPPPYAKAGQVLEFFERPASGNGDGRAEGLYLLSRRLTLIRQQGIATGRVLRADGGQAVGYATQAYNTTQRPQFRRQACLAQLLFGETRDEGYCSAAGQREERTESHLYEGMYWLRRGQRERDTVRMSSWSHAIQSFNRGLAESPNGVSAEGVYPTLPATLDLADLLRYGERYVLRCARLDYGDRESASNEVKAFFKLSGMPDPCGGAPR
jgi:tetratricopeptide (TPR) repeat protein